VIDHPTKL